MASSIDRPNPAPAHLRREGHRSPSARRRAANGSCVMPALAAIKGFRRGYRGCCPGDADQWYPVVKRTRFAGKAYFLLIATSMQSSKNPAERRQIFCWKCAVNEIRWRSRAASTSKRYAKCKCVANCWRNHIAAVTRMPGGSSLRAERRCRSRTTNPDRSGRQQANRWQPELTVS